MAGEDQQEAFDRGHLAGEIAERLAAHDRHFNDINGSIKHVADELARVNMQLQRLGDQAMAREATVVTTAAALKESEEARRNKSESSWSPAAKTLTVIGALVGLAGLVVAVYLALRPR
jgi:hypothetical protein